MLPYICGPACILPSMLGPHRDGTEDVLGWQQQARYCQLQVSAQYHGMSRTQQETATDDKQRSDASLRQGDPERPMA